MSSGHHSIFEDQARELYVLCDEEKKGYITQDDIFRLKTHLPLTDDQLMSVFESLDADENGSLTFDEFIVGFGKFLGTSFDTPYDEDSDTQNDSTLDDAAKEHLDDLLHRVSTAGLSEDTELIKDIWIQFQSRNPDLLTDFEGLLENILVDVSRTKKEYSSLESMLKSKTNAYEEEMKHLYDEMDNQMKSEKERLLKEERQKEITMKSELESEILKRDKELQDTQLEHDKIRQELQIVSGVFSESSQERERLEKDKRSLEDRLNSTEKSLKDCQEYIDELNRKAKADKRKRARAAIEMTEGIALERETLVRQLDELKEINKQLQEEKLKKMQKGFSSNNEGMDLSQELSMCDPKSSPEPKVIDIREPVSQHKRGSILSSYFTPLINVGNQLSTECEELGTDGVDMCGTQGHLYESDIIEETYDYPVQGSQMSILEASATTHPASRDNRSETGRTTSHEIEIQTEV